MRHIKQTERPYHIRYIKGDRSLPDCASTLEHAKELIASRLAKPHNKGERAEVWYNNRELVFSTPT